MPRSFEFASVPSTVNVTIDKPVTVEGDVVLTESNQPAAGAQLEFDSDNYFPSGWKDAVADERGHYRLATLPPGEYRLTARLSGRPVLLRSGIKLHAGQNKLDLRMDKGALIKGRLVDASSGKPVPLPNDHILSIHMTDPSGQQYEVVPTIVVQPDGFFEVPVHAGEVRLGFNLGPNWEAVVGEESLKLAEGETRELEIKVKWAGSVIR